MRPSAPLLGLLAAGCGGERPFDPGRSVQIQFQVSGLPDGGAAQYQVFVQDTVPVAHGRVANTEIDTVRISSSAGLRARWQDALVPVGETDYVFVPGEREVFIDASNTDTSVAVAGSFALASGGFILTIPGVPPRAEGFWSILRENGSLLTNGVLRGSEVVRRGDLPPGPARLELDTALAELGGVQHYYAPAQRVVLLNLSVSLDLIPVDAPYALVSAAVRVHPSGLPPGTLAPWGLTTVAGDYSVGGQAETERFQIAGPVWPGSYNMTWGDVTVDGVTYRPNPATQPATLPASLVPYEFATSYSAVP